MYKRFRTAVMVLASAVAATVSVGTGTPANAADVVAMAAYNSSGQRCAEPVNGANGADVVLRACTGSGTQSWARISLGDGWYFVINQGYPNMCMDVRDGRDANGVAIQIWSCTLTKGMQWSFNRVLYPYDRIKSKISGRCVDLSGPADEGQALIVNPCRSGRTSEVWEIR
jgi:hypothetical protein